MAASRILEPEWLDELPATDPRAIRSRRDLVRVNALMGNVRIVAGDLSALGPPQSMAEIGAGDGRFLLAVVRRLDAAPASAQLVDRKPIVDAGTIASFEAAGCRAMDRACDVFDWLAEDGPPFDVIVANLFLHHFDDARLARLLEGVARRARAFVACEPRRGTVAGLGARLLGLVGCNDVTRHDAVASVRAGFVDDEISRLWPKDPRWTCREGARGLFGHGFVASRAA